MSDGKHGRDRYPMRRDWDHGPFDIVGDVHGCFDELRELLGQLGYMVSEQDDGGYQVEPPEGRTLIFVGDLVDRGPGVVPVLKLVMGMIGAGTALGVVGNHDDKLMRALKGRNVKIAHGLEESLRQLNDEPPEFKAQIRDFIASLPSHYVLDDGNLVVAHAGIKEKHFGRDTERVRDFTMYGDTTGETDSFGLPVRLDWALKYTGKALIVYGHTPVGEPRWFNNTVNIDTGCVFGGMLTALRYPERVTVSVPARYTYAETRRVFLPEGTTLPERYIPLGEGSETS